jgi:hypothetical protein
VGEIMAETQEEKIMRLLDCTLDEAKDVIRTDKEIDKGNRVYFDLPPEKEKIAKKFAHAGTRKTKSENKEPTVYKWDKRATSKANPTKEGIISYIAESLLNSGLDIQNLEIPNKGKLITFELDGNSYKLDLIQKRKPNA